MYEWLLFGHILGVVFLVEGFAVFVAAVDRLARALTLAELRTLVAVATLGERLLIGGGVCLIPFGLMMAAQYWSFSDGWILASFVLVLVQGAIGSALVSPRLRRLHAELLQAPGFGNEVPTGVAALARDRVMHDAGRVSIVSVIEIVFLMTVKPAGVGLFLSLLVAVVAAALGATSYGQRSDPLTPSETETPPCGSRPSDRGNPS